MGREENKDIRLFILEMRKNKSELTYEEIANRVHEKFGKQMTRQAVYEIYKKYSHIVMEEDAANDLIEVFIRVADITETINILNELNKKGLSDYNWSRRGSVEGEFIKKNMKLVMERSSQLEGKVYEMLNSADNKSIDIHNIANELSYKGIVPKESVVSDYVDVAIVIRCEKLIRDELCRVYDKLYPNSKDRLEKKKNSMTALIMSLNEKKDCNICEER